MQSGLFPFTEICTGCNGSSICIYYLQEEQYIGKKINKRRNPNHRREVDILKQVHHENVISFHGEYDSQGIDPMPILLLELCQSNLYEYIKGETEPALQNTSETDDLGNYFQDVTFVNLVEQMAKGVDYLHNNVKIIHGDINPRTVLLKKSPSGTKVKLSSFGCSKLFQNNAVGEVLESPQNSHFASFERISKSRVNTSTDVFSLGAVIYFIYSKGGHPFGKLQSGEKNIKEKKTPNLQYLTSRKLSRPDKEEYVCAEDLVRAMICHDEKERIDIQAVLRHPYFWSSRRKLDFFRALRSHQLSKKAEHQSQHVYDSFDCKILQANLPVEIADDYPRCNNVKELIRIVRNLEIHVTDTTTNEAKKKCLGVNGTDFDCNVFWTKLTGKYPYLLIHLYNGFKQITIGGDFYPKRIDDQDVNSDISPTSIMLCTQEAGPSNQQVEITGGISGLVATLCDNLGLAEADLYEWQLEVFYETLRVLDRRVNFRGKSLTLVDPGNEYGRSPGRNSCCVTLPKNTNSDWKSLQEILDNFKRGIDFTMKPEGPSLTARRRTKAQVFLIAEKPVKLEQGVETELFSFPKFLAGLESSSEVSNSHVVVISVGSPVARKFLTVCFSSRPAQRMALSLAVPGADHGVALSGEYLSNPSLPNE